ncbi:MAG: efflux RND transporter periplasmic adaptor subunit [Alphaproteobacteria bacterium]|nr:efflux RND transporter periplasmic adaptor subunit [Alphaproteobacteria bacterium]
MELSRKHLLTLAAFALLLAGGTVAITSLRAPAVRVAHPVTGPAVQAVYATGTVEATVMMPIAARATARLTELKVDEGSNVAKDQVLASLEDEDLQNTLRELKAREEYAKGEFERKEALVKRGFASRDIYEQSKSAWEAAKAATARAEAEIGYLKLTAPADGRIIRRDGEVGQMIPANQPVFWLSCCAPLRISAEVDEEDIALVQPSQKVLIRADAFPGRTFHGTVQAITPKGDPVARSYRVRIGFEEENPLLIGMTAEVNIIIRETKEALLVPASALTDGALWVVKDGVLDERKITAGAKTPERVEIVSGVTTEDLVVIKPENMEAGRRARTVLQK